MEAEVKELKKVGGKDKEGRELIVLKVKKNGTKEDIRSEKEASWEKKK